MRRTGFTLIELLVVIAIIAILAAILFPVFERAKNKAQQASCMSNLKQMGLAIHMYTSDWDQQLPNYVSGNFWPYTCTGRPPAENTDACHAAWGGKDGWLWRYIQSEEVFKCPSRAAATTASGLISGTTARAYYTYESNAIGFSTKASAWCGYNFGPTIFPGKSMDYFNYPTHFMVFADGESYLYCHPEARGAVWYTVYDCGFMGGTLYPNATSPHLEQGIYGMSGLTDIGGLKARHNGMINCLFLDGHVAPLAPGILGSDRNGLGLVGGVDRYYVDANGAPGGGQSKP